MESLQILIAEQQPWLQALIGLALLALAAAAVNFLVKKVLLRAAAPFLDRRSLTVDKAAARLANVLPALIVGNGIYLVPYLPEALVSVVQNVASALIVVSIAFAISGMLDYVDELYRRRPEARSRPIKGYIQLLKIVLFAGTAILVIAALMEQSPLLLLSGLGAMAAVLMLVFKDTILSLVASVQLSSNDMLRVGDWIEMPELNADGDVIDIALHTVKVQNWDKTITTIPTYRLISDSFKNWRGMKESGGRRMKRPLLIDQNSIRFLQQDEIQRLRRFSLLDDYLARKDEELRNWNESSPGAKQDPVNARKLTNIGTFRAYVIAYLKAHDRVDQAKTMLVRQLDPTPAGLPLEVYAFANTTEWGDYETVQSDIFDHLLAIMPEFGLRLFQEPSGLDFQSLSGAARH
ncbi:miniconductance mechanosensitive channel [Altererythrobacter atlanticus]|uniref:Mechanosensing system component YbdG n=1 Tax=Croceibacterium atlanticum TaxID=1267766 RepID=A0A0F7KX29_9SPHN|nr:mechanosensitive ion channel domain-containing protein [Croceibacterium atlanticum]AKH43777.1 Miniconductance mechanosensitive channel YbdG [Croceibacterium atlanticum]MBB5733774.1 miniconductance mechanosensitive channel [Croceibacterium atlanticum]